MLCEFPETVCRHYLFDFDLSHYCDLSPQAWGHVVPGTSQAMV